MNIKDIYWIAGFLEGEGCFGLTGKKYPVISVGQKQKQPLERLRNLLLHGSLGQDKEGMWRYKLTHFRAIELMMTIYNIMSPIRQKKIKIVIDKWRTLPGLGSYNRNKTHCSRGHLFTEESILPSKSGSRSCRVCFNQLRKEWGKLNPEKVRKTNHEAYLRAKAKRYYDKTNTQSSS